MSKSVNIIGGGVGGLCCAALLAKRGLKVRLFEKLPKVGGAVDSFTRKGYGFEATTHQITSSQNLRRLVRELELGEAAELIVEGGFYDVFYINEGATEKVVRLPAGRANLERRLCELYPAERDGIKCFFKGLAAVNRDMDRLIRLGEAKFPPLYLYDMLTALMLKRGKDGGLAKRIGMFSYRHMVGAAKSSFAQFLDRYTLSEELRSLLSQYCLYLSATADEASAVMMAIIFLSYLNNSPALFKGGSHSFIEGLVRVIEENGGEIRCRSAIEHIEVEDEEVKAIFDGEGNRFRADYTVSNISVYKTFMELIGEERVDDPDYIEFIKGLRLASSTFTVYVGMPGTLSDYGFHSKTAFFNYSKDYAKARSKSSPAADSLMLFSDYSHLNKEGGKSSFAILELDDYRNWKDIPYHSEQYEVLKRERTALILDKFEAATGIPVRERAEVIFAASPLTGKYYMSNCEGEMLGLKVDVEQGLNGRPAVDTPVNNLFLTGHYSRPCGGVNGVITGAFETAKMVCKAFK